MLSKRSVTFFFISSFITISFFVVRILSDYLVVTLMMGDIATCVLGALSDLLHEDFIIGHLCDRCWLKKSYYDLTISRILAQDDKLC